MTFDPDIWQTLNLSGSSSTAKIIVHSHEMKMFGFYLKVKLTKIVCLSQPKNRLKLEAVFK